MSPKTLIYGIYENVHDSKKFYHFDFRQAYNGTVKMKELAGPQFKEFAMRSSETVVPGVDTLAYLICQSRLMAIERIRYIHQHVRPFVAAPFQDILCHAPPSDKK
jgi:hypothetical protein